jgi:hypothetical protein
MKANFILSAIKKSEKLFAIKSPESAGVLGQKEHLAISPSP